MSVEQTNREKLQNKIAQRNLEQLAFEVAEEAGQWVRATNRDNYHLPDPDEPDVPVCTSHGVSKDSGKWNTYTYEGMPDSWVEGNICCYCLDILYEYDTFIEGRLDFEYPGVRVLRRERYYNDNRGDHKAR